MLSVTKFALAVGVLAGAAVTAQAADLPARVAPAPYIAPLPIFTWTGAYFGINAGAAFDNKQEFTTTADRSDGIGNTRFSDSGFSAGGQIGYNYEFNGFGGGLGGPGSGIVIGLEADAMYMDTDKSINLTTNNGTASFRSGLDFLGTARGRLGYAFNQFLVYGTGGFAYGNVNSRVIGVLNGSTSVASESGFNTGYTYGGGVEYALPTGSFLNFFHSSAVTVKAEYLRYELDSTNLRDSDVNTVNLPAGLKVKNEGNIARVGLNYKF